MIRNDFQRLALLRIKESKVLLREGFYNGSYYLSGYAVECALKACIAKKTRRYEFPDKELVKKIYTHDLSQLLKVAGLEGDYRQRSNVDAEFELRWNVVKLWSEDARYEHIAGPFRAITFPKPSIRSRAEERARTLHDAIVNRKRGILPWLKMYW